MLHPFWARYAAFEPLETNRIKDTNEETQNNSFDCEAYDCSYMK